jgi:hypothetical protein
MFFCRRPTSYSKPFVRILCYDQNDYKQRFLAGFGSPADLCRQPAQTGKHFFSDFFSQLPPETPAVEGWKQMGQPSEVSHLTRTQAALCRLKLPDRPSFPD